MTGVIFLLNFVKNKKNSKDLGSSLYESLNNDIVKEIQTSINLVIKLLTMLNNNKKMEFRNHFKNGAQPKSLMSRKQYYEKYIT